MAGAWDGHDTRGSTTGANTARAAIAEAVGTFLLVLVGTAVATAAVLGKNTAGPAYDSLAIALSFGLALTAIVATLGPTSGAHVNPAVTVGLAVTGAFPWRAVPAYIVAQVVGAVLAALAVWGTYGARAYDAAHLGAPAPVHGATAPQVFLVEALIAFLLVFTVVAATTDARVPAGVAPPAIGFALAGGVLLGGPVSGGAGNPARALGPMLVAGTYPDIVMYILAPLVGGILAAVLYGRVVAAAPVPQATPRVMMMPRITPAAAAPRLPTTTSGATRASAVAWARAKGRTASATHGRRPVTHRQASPLGHMIAPQDVAHAAGHARAMIVPTDERLPVAASPDGSPRRRPRQAMRVAGAVVVTVLTIVASLAFLRRDGE